MTFKAYETELDEVGDKLGLNKRSFKEWGEQVKYSFNHAEKGLRGFKDALVAAIKVSQIKLIDKNDFASIFSMDTESFFQSFNVNGAKSISTLTQWCKQLKVSDRTMKAYLVDCIQKQVPALFDGYVKHVKTATESTNQLTLATKAGHNALMIFKSISISLLVSKGIELVVQGIDYLVNS